MSFGFGFALPAYPLRGGGGNNPFNQSGPTLDLSFAGVVTNLSDPNGYTLTTDFIVPQYQVAAQYTIWEAGVGLVDKTFSQIITFTRATSATFTGSNGLIQSAAIDAPRFDYDPVTLAAKGLLIEEQRTNLALYSNDFANAWWNKIGGSITSTTEIAPDGSTTACVFSASATNAELYKSVTLAAGTIYTSSIYIKRKTGTGTISIRNSANTNWIPVTINSSTWTRVTNDSGASSGNAYCDILISTLGDEIYVWGAQLEAGAFATSYIPTVASQVTRNADSASMLGDNFYTWYNPNQGTLSSDYIINNAQVAGAPSVVSISDNTNDNRIQLSHVSGDRRAVVTSVGIAQFAAVGGALGAASVGVAAKLASVYKASDFAACANSGSIISSASGSVPGGLSRITIGADGAANLQLNGTIRSIRYYTVRLPNATLQQITS